MNSDDLHEILGRAQELDTLDPLDPEVLSEFGSVIESAAEAGISREAVLRAIRERLAFVRDERKPGDLVFAMGADGDYHVARYESSRDGYERVRFMNGTEVEILASAVRPFRLLPGETVHCPWPKRGWVSCPIKEYLPEKEWVYVTSPEGETKYFDLEEIRLLERTPISSARLSDWPMRIALMLGTGLVASAVTWLLCR